METDKTRTENPGSVLDDPREISAVTWYVGELGVASFRVGRSGTTKIAVYKEHGQCGWVPWIAIYKGDIISDRIDAMGKEIEYKEGYPHASDSTPTDSHRLS